MSRAIHIVTHKLCFSLPNGKLLFNNLNIAFTQQKIGLVGKNGVGKSTLNQLIIGERYPTSGSIQVDGSIAYVAQNPVVSTDETIADLLGFAEKIHALHRITQGSINEQDYLIFDEDWAVEERLHQQLSTFGLHYLPYSRSLKSLSGGELTRILLTKAFFSDADFLLLDEPTNHLDTQARKQLYTAIENWRGGMIVISHDRALLNVMEEIVELSTLGAKSYGGNYQFYTEQKAIEKAACESQLHDAKKLIHKTQQTIQSSKEKHEQKQSYGRKLRKSGSIDKLSANAKKGRSERTQSKLLIKEERLLDQAEKQIQSAKSKIEISDEIHIDLPATNVPAGKTILEVENLQFNYPENLRPIIDDFNLIIQGPERIALNGNNGSGKTTLINLILGLLTPCRGNIHIGTEHVRYLDQHASLLQPELSIIENFLQLNPTAKEHHAHQCLAKFLFKNVTALKQVKSLSGGEKLRALLACTLLSNTPPQLLILDEPTNHLDIKSIESIESALKNYQGAMIVISHDDQFLKNIHVEKFISLRG